MASWLLLLFTRLTALAISPFFSFLSFSLIARLFVESFSCSSFSRYIPPHPTVQMIVLSSSLLSLRSFVHPSVRSFFFILFFFLSFSLSVCAPPLCFYLSRGAVCARRVEKPTSKKGREKRREEFSGFIRLCADVLDKNSKKNIKNKAMQSHRRKSLWNVLVTCS